MKHKTQRTTVDKRKETLSKYNNTPERKQKMKEYYEKNKHKWKDKQLQRDYGIDLNEYTQMLHNQDNKCYICEKHRDEFNRDFAVDHCHSTGKVRHLLCNNCNTSLGLLKENKNIMKKLIEYMELHE